MYQKTKFNVISSTTTKLGPEPFSCIFVLLLIQKKMWDHLIPKLPSILGPETKFRRNGWECIKLVLAILNGTAATCADSFISENRLLVSQLKSFIFQIHEIFGRVRRWPKTDSFSERSHRTHQRTRLGWSKRFDFYLSLNN